ncbi:MAG: GNAT family N-acetyltransferase [Acidimicrobiales bacterium]
MQAPEDVPEPAPLGRSARQHIAALCERSLADPPSAAELNGALFAEDQAAVVLGDPATGVIAVVECDDGAHIRLLAVDPSARRRGLGHALVQAAEDWAVTAGHRTLATGADPPYFLWPGVPSSETALVCLFERRHYRRADTNFNMEVDLRTVPDDPGGHRLAGAGDTAELDEWTAAHWPNWRLEVLRALDKGNLVIARDGGASGPLTAFCAFEVNRRGVLGPVAVRPDLMGRGAGRGVLLGALHELRRRGAQRVAVVWVGPVAPYAAVGGRVSDVYFVYRKEVA